MFSPLPVTTRETLKRPQCGKTGTARIAHGGERPSASAVIGFVVTIDRDNLLEITCAKCSVAVYEVK